MKRITIEIETDYPNAADDEVSYAERVGTPVVHIPPTKLDIGVLAVV